LYELQHRARNLLGVVNALTERTLARSSSLEDFHVTFRDRRDALARVNGLLSRLNEGDRITLRSSTVQTLALGLHELTINAVTYGALSPGGGRLSIRWSIERMADGTDPAARRGMAGNRLWPGADRTRLALPASGGNDLRAHIRRRALHDHLAGFRHARNAFPCLTPFRRATVAKAGEFAESRKTIARHGEWMPIPSCRRFGAGAWVGAVQGRR
jgi:hypothetical protein